MKTTKCTLLAGLLLLALRLPAQQAMETPPAASPEFQYGIRVQANGPAYQALPDIPCPYVCPCCHGAKPDSLDRTALLEALLDRMEAIMAEEKAKQQRDE